MNKRILLVDWDDVVMDRKKVRELQKERAVKVLGEAEAEGLWAAYRDYQSRHGGRVSVDSLINSLPKDQRDQAFEVFYGIDFSRCVDREGWNLLTAAAEEAGVEMRIFSEGSRSYQMYKISHSGLSVPLVMLGAEGVGDVFDNKLLKYDQMAEQIEQEGDRLVGYADDRISYLSAIYEKSAGKVQCFWVNKETEVPVPEWLAGRVSGLAELAAVVTRKLGPEGVVAGPEGSLSSMR